MTRLPLLLLSLGAVGAILWVTMFGASGPARQKSRPPRDRPRSVQPKAKLRIAGHVQSADGAPIAGATVFVLPKERRGSNRDAADHEVTDAQGQWALRTRKTVGCWIGVVAAGYRNTYLDGDTLDASVQMFLVMQPAPSMTVTLKDADGSPLHGIGVQVVPWPDSGASYFLPGPEGRQGEQWRVADKAGEAVFVRGDRGPVTIAVDAPGRHASPTALWVASCEGSATRVLRPSASLAIDLRQPTGEPAQGLAAVTFLDADSGRALFALTDSTTDAGGLLLQDAVPPGTYHVEVRLEGGNFGSALATDVGVALATPPQRLELRLGAVQEQGPGSLQVHLEGNAAHARPGTRRRAPLAFFRRTDGNWARRGWTAGAPSSWKAAEDTLTFELDPGRYDLLVADVATGRVALEQDIEIAGSGSLARRGLEMTPGQRGRMPPVLAAGVYTRAIRIQAEGWPRLPVYGGTRDGLVRTGRTLDVIGRSLTGSEVWLGPYPFDEFTLTVERSDGTTASESFR